MITPVVKKYVPRVMKNSLARVIKQTQDRYWRARFGRLSSLVPPLQLMHDGGQSYKEFKQNGDEFLRLYKRCVVFSRMNTCSMSVRESAARPGHSSII